MREEEIKNTHRDRCDMELVLIYIHIYVNKRLGSSLLCPYGYNWCVFGWSTKEKVNV